MSTQIRCTYCLLTKPVASFTEPEHVVPASLGGTWRDPKVCDRCNKAANIIADQLIANDPLVGFLRDAYRIRDRRGFPPPCKFSVPVPEGGVGVVKVTLGEKGATYQAGMPASTIETLDLDPSDQDELEQLVAKALDLDDMSQLEPLGLARAAQQFAAKPTPPMTWSRFMAKIGLACGRDAYGDAWLDSHQASILSGDLLGSAPPRFSQRTHYPPVEPVWPFEPPKHQVWIRQHEDTAVLSVALFGQVLGAMPVSNEMPPQGAYSAWWFDPRARTFGRSSYLAMWTGTAAAKLTREGHNVVTILSDEHPLFFVEDGPNGPADLPIPTTRADSPMDAFQKLVESQEKQADD